MHWSRHLAVAALGATLVYVVMFWQLGVPSFWDPDEAHYAQTSREMLASGDWWAPYYNEEPFFDKPALFHQFQATAMWLFGPTEFAARVIPAAASLALVLITLWFGAAVVSTEVGVVAALLLTASPGIFALSRYAILDTVFTMFLFGGAALLAVAAVNDRPRLQWPGYVALALAVLVKGPLALVLCGLAFLIAIAASADLRRRLLGLRWVLGLLVVLALSGPWFVYMYIRFREAFVAGYLLDENIRLYSGRRFANQPGFWFYFRILAAGLLPWTGLLLGRLYDDVRAAVRRAGVDSIEVLLWSWTVATVGFFTFSTFKLDHYVFPAAPALCLLCARAWFDLRSHSSASRDIEYWGARVGLHLIGPLLVAVGLGCGYFLIARLELSRAAIAVPIAVTVAGVLLTVLMNIRGGYSPQVPWIVLSALLVTYTGLIAFVMPALDGQKVVHEMAGWIASHATDEDRIATYELNRWNPTFRFYVGRHTTMLEEVVEAEAFFRASQPFYCLMRRRAFDEFAARGAPLVLVHEREGLWATSGRALWRRRTRHERFVIVAGSHQSSVSVY